MSLATLLLGSNIDPRINYLTLAWRALEYGCGSIIKSSAIYESEAWGFQAGKFLNRAVVIETTLAPLTLLSKIKQIEEDLGRKRSLTNDGVYHSRTIDLDILFYDDLQLDHPQLQIPHPKIAERRFVLVPLNEILPNFVHPSLNKTISRMLEDCADKGEVVVFNGT